METVNYKGKGEHSVNELELIIKQQAEELHLFRSGQKQIKQSENKTNKIMMSENKIKLQKAYMLTVLIEKYYETDGAGGCVHIITDDGNYGKGYAQFCLDYAIKQKDYWGEHIARLLLEFNEDEQEQIIERSWEIYEQIR